MKPIKGSRSEMIWRGNFRAAMSGALSNASVFPFSLSDAGIDLLIQKSAAVADAMQVTIEQRFGAREVTPDEI